MHHRLATAVVLVGLGFASSGCQASLLRQDEGKIRESFLLEKPLGTSMQDVELWIRSKSWTNVKVSRSAGFFRDGNFPKGQSTVGVRSITAHCGSYISASTVGLNTDVVGSWGFNERGELIEVWIEKSVDAP